VQQGKAIAVVVVVVVVADVADWISCDSIHGSRSLWT